MQHHHYVSHVVIKYQAPSHFSACNIEKLGEAWGTRLHVCFMYSGSVNSSLHSSFHTGGLGSIGKVVSIKDWKNETTVSTYMYMYFLVVELYTYMYMLYVHVQCTVHTTCTLSLIHI